MSDGNRPPGLNDLEAALANLTPRPPALDRDALLYRAGRASAGRWWPLATCVSTTVAAALAVILLVRPPAERIVYLPAPAPRPATESAAPEPEPSPPAGGSGLAAYFRLEEQVLNRGLDGLPRLPAGTGPAVTAEELLRGL